MYLFKDKVYLKKLINCFTVWHLFTMDRKVNTWFRTDIHWITIVVLPWISFSSLNINWKYFKSIPPNIGSDQEEQFWCLNIDRVALFYDEMSIHAIRKREVRFMLLRHKPEKLLVYCWHGFCFEVLYRFDVCMIEKSTVFFICTHKWVKSAVFVLSIKFCEESGLENVKYMDMYRTKTKNIDMCINKLFRIIRWITLVSRKGQCIIVCNILYQIYMHNYMAIININWRYINH